MFQKEKIRDFFLSSENINDSIYRFLKNAVCVRSFNVNYSDTTYDNYVCPTVLGKYDFNRRRVLNGLSAVDEVAGMDAKTFAICDNCGGKVKSLCLNKTFTKIDVVWE